jgi:hypothetical protein
MVRSAQATPECQWRRCLHNIKVVDKPVAHTKANSIFNQSINPASGDRRYVRAALTRSGVKLLMSVNRRRESNILRPIFFSDRESVAYDESGPARPVKSESRRGPASHDFDTKRLRKPSQLKLSSA